MFIYNNTDILNPDDMKLRPMNGYGIKPYGPRTGLRVLSGLGAYDPVGYSGGLQPGQRITFDQAKYMFTGGQSVEQPAQYAYLTPEYFNQPGNPFGGLQGFLDYFQNTLLRLTAQKKTDDEYAAYIAARAAAAPDAAALLVFDANGRATDESVQAANDYQNAVTADEYAKVTAAQQQYEQTVAAAAAAATAAAAAATPPTYTDAELAMVIEQRLIDLAQLPGEVVAYLVNTMKVDAQRANALVNAQFATLQTEYIAAQTAKREAAEAQARQAQQAAIDAEAARQAKAVADYLAKEAQDARAELAKAQAATKAAIDELLKSKTTTPTVTPLPGDITKLPVITTPPTTPAAGGLGPLLLAVAAAYVLGA